MYFGLKLRGEFRVQLDISDGAFVHIASSQLISLMDGSIFDWAPNTPHIQCLVSNCLVYSMHKSCLSVDSLNKFTNLIKEYGTPAFHILLQASFKCVYSQVQVVNSLCYVTLKHFFSFLLLIFFFFFLIFCCSSLLFFTLSDLLQQLLMIIKFPCKICNKAVANNYHAVQCDKCHIWLHIKCNKINLQT